MDINEEKIFALVGSHQLNITVAEIARCSNFVAFDAKHYSELCLLGRGGSSKRQNWACIGFMRLETDALRAPSRRQAVLELVP